MLRQRRLQPVQHPALHEFPPINERLSSQGLRKLTGSRDGITKRDQIVALLMKPDGATIAELMEATGWQQHSLRGFFSATIKKQLGLDLTSTRPDGEPRRYSILSKEFT